jgi:hypothetical protein
MFIIAPFTIAKFWKQPRWPQLMNGLRKCNYVYTMAFYSAIKKNEIILFAGRWMELENFMLSEIRQVQNIKGHIFSHIWQS